MTSSHRYTTSSRQPGVVQHGVVQVHSPPRRVCDDCGRVTTEEVMPDMHGLHWVVKDGRPVKVNCVGRPVESQEPVEEVKP